MKGPLFFLAVLLFTLSTYAQEDYLTRQFSPQALQEDFKVLRESLEEAHPGLYWYRSKQEMDAAFDDMASQITSSMTEKEFFTLIEPIIPKVGCLHTRIYPSEAFSENYWQEAHFLPLDIWFENGKAYVRNNYSGMEVLEPGLEIVSVNGVTIPEIINHTMQRIPSDGFTETLKMFVLNRRYLNVLLNYYYERVKEYRLVVKKEGGTEEVIVPGIPTKEYWKVRPEPMKAAIALNFLEGGKVAVLRMNRFDNWKENGKKYKFRKFLEAYMDQIIESDAEYLIMDVGDQGGGWELHGLEVMKYLIDEPFTGYQKVEFTKKKWEARKHSNTSWWEYQLYKAILRFKKSEDGRYLLAGYKGTKEMEPYDKRFTGKVYMLTSGYTASATSDFAALVDYHNLATVVGEESGGSYVGNTSNYEFIITLPHSKIRMQVPLARYLLNVGDYPHKGRGVIPDYQVSQTIEDWMTGRDTQLEFTLDLIRSEMSQ